ncbi:Uncharacterised protein [Streptococcus pneumoniae]|uniref:hypothetical protein n=1 Tax=Streptococcus pneumoniae TaxID=1313 RepID=UPI0005EA4E64|nr:hypothetical protein [Streptococcus pneumoniae]UKP71153.1 hypothetical protein EQH17_10380 [Streptococcus pneumoniae]CAG5278863.1 Uncharacterised protein [Streptococcus pneumoniae]CAG5418938.1 Uncharacterised protein [Streptococcus pneumoniae]CAG5863320.1 Uncharacterised protein [Streptococcus pneumoniae]CAG5921303.1 Uncharacterised protein [Streptococcus pneumoniae]
MTDHQLETSLIVLGKEFDRTKKNGKESFSVHVSFFDGLDTNYHLQEFARQYPVRIARLKPDQITFLID